MKCTETDTVKDKCELFPVHDMKAYRASRGMEPLILNLGTRWKCVVKFTPRRFIIGKEARYQLNSRLGRPQCQYDVMQKGKNSRSKGVQTPDRLAHSVVTIPTTLPLFPNRQYYFKEKPGNITVTLVRIAGLKYDLTGIAEPEGST